MLIIRILFFLTILACLTACLRLDASNEISPDSLAGTSSVVTTSLSLNQVKLDRISAGKAANAYIQITRDSLQWLKSFEAAEALYRSLRSSRITLVCIDGGSLTVAGGRRGDTFQISLENRACRTGDSLESGTIRYVYLIDSFRRKAIEFVDYRKSVLTSYTEVDGRLSAADTRGPTDFVLNLSYTDSSREVYRFDDLRIPNVSFTSEESFGGKIIIDGSRQFDVDLTTQLEFANSEVETYPIRGAFTLSSGVESLKITAIDGIQTHLEYQDEEQNVRLATLEWKNLVVESLPLDSGEKPQAHVNNIEQYKQIEFQKLTDLNSVVLDGKSSVDPENDLLGFEWRIIEAPDESAAIVEDSNRDIARLLPDKFGNYKIGLTVRDATQESTEYQFDVGIDPGQGNVNINASIKQLAPGLDDDFPAFVTNRVIEIDGSNTSNGYPFIQFSFSAELRLKPYGSRLLLGSFDNNSLSFSPDLPGYYEVVVTASDGLYQSERVYGFDVIDYNKLVGVKSSVVGPTYGVVGENMVWQSPLESDSLIGKIISFPVGSVAELKYSDNGDVEFVPDVAGAYSLELNFSNLANSLDTQELFFYVKPSHYFGLKTISDISVSTKDLAGYASLPQSMLVGDINNDGSDDLIMPLKNYRISVPESRFLTLFGLGEAKGFGKPVYNSVNKSIGNSGAILDFDGDNHNDILLETAELPYLGKVDSNNILQSAWLNIPQGRLTNRQLADFNNDGLVDYLYYGTGAGLVCVSKQNLYFQFFIYDCPIVNLPENQVIVGVFQTDVNADTNADIVILSRSYELKELSSGIYYNVAYLPGNGDGTFAATQILATHLDGAPLDNTLRVVDIDHDGDVDIVSAGHYWIQIAPGVFAYRNGISEITSLIKGGRDLVLVDFNGDTYLDIFFLKDSYSGKPGISATIIFQKSPGIFGDGEEFLLGTDENYQDFPLPIPGVSAKDFDGDGDLDILITGASARVDQARLYMLENLKN